MRIPACAIYTGRKYLHFPRRSPREDCKNFRGDCSNLLGSLLRDCDRPPKTEGNTASIKVPESVQCFDLKRHLFRVPVIIATCTTTFCNRESRAMSKNIPQKL